MSGISSLFGPRRAPPARTEAAHGGGVGAEAWVWAHVLWDFSGRSKPRLQSITKTFCDFFAKMETTETEPAPGTVQVVVLGLISQPPSGFGDAAQVTARRSWDN